jgi:hypothetical protein
MVESGRDWRTGRRERLSGQFETEDSQAASDHLGHPYASASDAARLYRELSAQHRYGLALQQYTLTLGMDSHDATPR